MRRLLELRQYRVHNFRSFLTECFFNRESFFNRAVCLDLLFSSLLVKRKALELLFSLLSSSPELSRVMGYFEQNKCFTDHRTTNTIQLFVAMKENLSDLFFYCLSRKGRRIPEGLLDKSNHLFIFISLK